MRSDARSGGRGLALALVLTVAGLALAWLCFRTTIVRALPATSPLVVRLAPGDDDALLARAAAVAGRGGRIDAATLDGVHRAAAVAPLDARPFLIVGRQQIADGATARATATLEAGQRLDPRNRLIHLLLLERYLLASRFAEASTQFATLARLVGRTQPAIATAMAQMAMAPEMRTAVRRTLRSDPALERAVLVALAQGDTAPGDIFALASPAALASAGDKESWGPALVARLVAGGRYAAARAVWQRVYRLPQAATAGPIFNSSFRPLPASAPFDWTLTANSTGAADPQNGTLSVDYYGRDNGDLASQLLVLAPGRYEIAFVVEGGKADAASRLFWSLSCAPRGTPRLADVLVPMAPGTRRIAAAFAVPASCPAQMLTLRGEAGEFPSPVNLTIGNLAIRPATETRP